jgi:hypothetical protein
MKSTLTLSLAHFGRGMKRRSGGRSVALSVILTALIVAGLSAGLRGAKAQSDGQNPDYSQVNDVLYGGTHLLRNDDLVITFVYQNPANEFREVLFTAGTQDSNANILRFDHSVNIPNGQAGCSTSGGCYLDFHYHNSGQLKFATGRFFDTDRDTTVLYPFHFLEAQTPLLLSLAGESVPTNAAGLVLTTAQDVSFVIGGDLFFSEVADFNGDGYDDLLMAWSNAVGNPHMRIATAVNVTDPTQGFKFGPLFTPAAPFGIRRVTVGDFNGDGQPDIVQAYIDPSRQLTLATYRVDPATLTIAEGAQLGYLQAADTGPHPVELAAGHFTALGHHQLVVGAQLADGDQVHMGFFDFAPNSLQPQRVTSVFFPDAATGMLLLLKAARFIWSNPFDQIAWMSSSGAGTRLSVLIVDPQSQTVVRKADILPVPDVISQPNVTIFGYDIAVGNFDHRQQGQGGFQERDPDLQIALIAARRPNDGGLTGTAALYLYSVSQDLATLTNTWHVGPGGDFFGGNNILNMSIMAGDMQGRSYRLGRGTKITIEDYMQPSAITAMPPMHVAFVIPSGGTAPTVLNLSAVPDSFNTKYVIEVENNTDSTQTDTVSHSFGFKETVGASFEVGDYDEGEGVKVEDTVTATQDITNSNETVQGTFVSRNETIGITTGWGDSVSYSSTTFNFWVYEVLGQKVCPQGKPDCQDSDKRPLTVQFSAPSTATEISAVGPLIEWYQPLWEPGNVFSYPANFAQLQQSVGATIDKLTQDRTYFTDSQSVEQNTTWRSGVSASTTIGTDKTFSGDNTLSVAGKVGVGDVFTVGGEVSFEASGSDAFSNNTQTHGETNQSTGVTFTKPGTFAEQSLYAYAFTPYIFGTVQPPNFVDSVDLTTQVKTFGPLRSAFVADPTHPGSGAWWSRTYTRPDVALNHPSRWAVTPQPLSRPLPANCLAAPSPTSPTPVMDCVDLNQATPDDPWSSAVHYMRGFFISSASKPGAGPQREMALEGEQLRLQARVYNYSLAPMAGQVHVRFYGVPWNPSTNVPAGNAFLIGEAVPGPIPPFAASSTAPNWVLASTTWDTTNRGNQYFTFFVLAWIQQGDGSNASLGQEMLGHGLSGLPGTLTSFSDAAQLEEIVSGQPVSYSNNLGFYNHAFYVIPQSSSATLAQTQPAPGDVRLEQIELAQPQVAAGQSLEVAVHLRTHTQSASGVHVVFYDGDPQHGGRAFDEERIAHIRAHDTTQARVRFRPDVCGARRIYVTVGRGKPYEVTDASHPVQVPCE